MVLLVLNSIIFYFERIETCHGSGPYVGIYSEWKETKKCLNNNTWILSRKCETNKELSNYQSHVAPLCVDLAEQGVTKHKSCESAKWSEWSNWSNCLYRDNLNIRSRNRTCLGNQKHMFVRCDAFLKVIKLFCYL
jgi:hypothetical protein